MFISAMTEKNILMCVKSLKGMDVIIFGANKSFQRATWVTPTNKVLDNVMQTSKGGITKIYGCLHMLQRGA